METVYCFLIEHHFRTLVGEPKFLSWGTCILALTNMHSDLRFNPSSGLAIFHALVWLLNSSLFPLFISQLGVEYNITI